MQGSSWKLFLSNNYEAIDSSMLCIQLWGLTSTTWWERLHGYQASCRDCCQYRQRTECRRVCITVAHAGVNSSHTCVYIMIWLACTVVYSWTFFYVEGHFITSPYDVPLLGNIQIITERTVYYVIHTILSSLSPQVYMHALSIQW